MIIFSEGISSKTASYLTRHMQNVWTGSNEACSTEYGSLLLTKLRCHCISDMERARASSAQGPALPAVRARAVTWRGRCLYRCFSKENNGKTLPVQTPTALPAYSKKTRGKNNIWWKIMRGKGLKVWQMSGGSSGSSRLFPARGLWVMATLICRVSVNAEETFEVNISN